MQRRIGDFFGLKRNAVGNQTEKLKKRQKTEVVDLISGLNFHFNTFAYCCV